MSQNYNVITLKKNKLRVFVASYTYCGIISQGDKPIESPPDEYLGCLFPSQTLIASTIEQRFSTRKKEKNKTVGPFSLSWMLAREYLIASLCVADTKEKMKAEKNPPAIRRRALRFQHAFLLFYTSSSLFFLMAI